jgi:hypothetical protein
MSARDDILAGLRAADSGSVGDETPEELLDAYRAEVLTEAVAAARAEYLTDDTGADEDAAYNQGVSDAIAAIGRLTEGGAEVRVDQFSAGTAEVRAAVLAEVADMLMAADETAAALLVDRLREAGGSRG